MWVVSQSLAPILGALRLELSGKEHSHQQDLQHPEIMESSLLPARRLSGYLKVSGNPQDRAVHTLESCFVSLTSQWPSWSLPRTRAMGRMWLETGWSAPWSL